MKLSAYAEKLLAKADAKPRPAPSAPGAKVAATLTPEAAPLPPALARLPALLKISEAAEYLALSADAVSNLRNLGVLTFIDIRVPGASLSSWRIDRASLAAFEAQRAVKP